MQTGLSELQKTSADEVIQLSYRFPPPAVSYEEGYDRISVKGLKNFGDAGEPSLPFKSIRVLIPLGMGIKRIEVIGNELILDGVYMVEPVQQPLTKDSIPVRTRPNQTIYSSDSPFPDKSYYAFPLQKFRGYNILILRLHPVQYLPKSGKIHYVETLDVKVFLSRADGTVSIHTGKYSGLRQKPEDEAAVVQMVENPEALASYRPSEPAFETLSIPQAGESYDYVIITNSTFNSTFWELANWKRTRTENPINATVVLVENITADADYWCNGTYGDGCGSGSQYNDTQAMIRNFIKDAYQNWGTRYVLLGGDTDVIAHRGVYGYVDPFEDTNIPCDMYYGGLDGNWNNDNDSYWAEGSSPEEGDLLAEVYIGRAPISMITEAGNFVNKTKAYENATFNNESYLRKAMFLGANADSSTEGGNVKDLITDIVPQYETTKYYNRDGTYDNDGILSEMNNGTHIINYVGHSSEDVFAQNGGSTIAKSDVDGLTNNDYFLVYSQGCDAAAFDYSDTVAEHFVKNPTGAFAFVGNSRYGWYYPGSSDGPSDKFDKEFFRAAMNGTLNLGAILAESKERLSGYMSSGVYRWVTFELNLLGDPETRLKVNLSSPTADFRAYDEHLLSPPVWNGTIQINGTARAGDAPDANFSNYTISWGIGTSPSQWFTDGITLSNNGANPVTNNMLGTIDTNFLPAGTKTLRLMVYDSSGNYTEDKLVVQTGIYPENKTVSSCRGFYSPGSNYTLSSNVSSTGTCFNISGADITLDCNDYTINYSNSSAGYGINASSGHDGIAIRNCKITQGSLSASSHGIYLSESSNSFVINNTITTVSNSSHAIHMLSSTTPLIYGNTLSTTGVDAYGIFSSNSASGNISYNTVTTSGSSSAGAGFFNQSSGFILLNDIIETSGQNAYGMEFSNLSNHTNITDCFVNASFANTADMFINETNGTALINTTISDIEFNDTSSYMTTYWYLDVYVNDTGGNPIEGANVTGLNVYNETVFSLLSGSNGYIQRQTLPEHNRSGITGYYTVASTDGKSYFTNYTINATKTGYKSFSAEINLTSTVSVYVTMNQTDLQGPNINMTSPENRSYALTSVQLNYSVSDVTGVDTCWYSLDGGSNTTLNSCQNTTLSSLGEGQHNVTLHSNDTLGNLNSHTIYFSVDLTKPTITIISPLNSTYSNRTYFNVTTNENTSWCGYSLDNATNQSLNSSNSTVWWVLNSSMADGSHLARFWCNDTAGNMNSTSSYFTADTVAPNITSFSLSSTSVYVGDTITSACTASDNHKGNFSGVVTGIDTSSAGTRTAVCTATDDGGNTAMSSINYTVSSRPSTTTSGGGGGTVSSGGGGTTDTTATEKKVVVIDVIPAGISQTVSVADSVTCLESITITTSTRAENVKITVESLSEKPQAVAAYTGPGKVYRYADITVESNAETMNDALIEKAEIVFSVNVSWLTENNIDETSVALHRFFNSSWEGLETNLVNRSETEVRYRAETPGFSYFMVSGRSRPACEQGKRRCNITELQVCLNGTWAQEQICEHGCDTEALACFPPPRILDECEPGESRCIHSRLEECQNGSWEEILTCPEGCGKGVCRQETNYPFFFLVFTFGFASVLSAIVFYVLKEEDYV